MRGVSPSGLAPPGTTMAEAMAWFQGRLYLASATPIPASLDALDPEARGRIHVRDAASATWSEVYVSPDDPRRGLPDSFGIRSLAVLRAAGDPAPCLYAGTLSMGGARVLRSADGVSFAPVSPPGLGDASQMFVRAMVAPAEGGPVFALTGGNSAFFDAELSGQAVVYGAADPAAGEWSTVCAAGFGDPANIAVTALAIAHGHVYAGTRNPTQGFQLWRSPVGRGGLLDWQQVLHHGAWRYTHNPAIVQMTAFGDDLYLGTGVPGPGVDRDFDIGPCAAEILCVRPDGTWDVVIGEPRFTPDGLKAPLGAMGAGFHSLYNAEIAALAVQDGVLYAGTRSWEPLHLQTLGDDRPLEGGYDLWATPDGIVWTPVRRGGAGNVAALSARVACPSPEGLYLAVLMNAGLLARQSNMWSGFGPGQGQPSDEFELFRLSAGPA
jgi:hypothetical protein